MQGSTECGWSGYCSDMQPVQVQKGDSTKSHLFNLLQTYLEKGNRQQPIIGLGSIIECAKAGAHFKELFYLCEVCTCQLSLDDIGSHIMGSLHRYNYIKSQYPSVLSEWKENEKLSDRAWWLMKKANLLEKKEGPGHVQFIEVEDALYNRMTTHSKDDAITLINTLKGERLETTSKLQGHSPIQSHKNVVFDQKTQWWPTDSLGISHQKHVPSSLLPSTMPQLDNDERSSEKSVLSENCSGYLKVYKGAMPLIGLRCVVECQSEDGCTHCFLCHCCRKRLSKSGIIAHLTCASHLVKYLMATRPHEVEVTTADLLFDPELHLSLARKVEQEEGVGKLMVVYAPESFCDQLKRKSHSWCTRKLNLNWTHFKIKKRDWAAKGPCVHKTSNEALPDASSVDNTVFKVSLPLSNGSVVLERTPFSKALPVAVTSPPPLESELRTASSHPQLEEREFDCSTQSLPSYPFSVGAEGSAVQGYSSNLQTNSMNVSKNETQQFYRNATQSYYRQQYMVQDNASFLKDASQQGPSGEFSPHFRPSWINITSHLGDPFAHSGNTAPDPRLSFSQSEQNLWKSYAPYTSGHVQRTPQSYMTQTFNQQTIQTSPVVTSHPNSSIGATGNTQHWFTHPTVIWTPR